MPAPLRLTSREVACRRDAKLCRKGAPNALALHRPGRRPRRRHHRHHHAGHRARIRRWRPHFFISPEQSDPRHLGHCGRAVHNVAHQRHQEETDFANGKMNCGRPLAPQVQAQVRRVPARTKSSPGKPPGMRVVSPLRGCQPDWSAERPAGLSWDNEATGGFHEPAQPLQSFVGSGERPSDATVLSSQGAAAIMGLHRPRARWWGVAWPPPMKWLSLQPWRAGGCWGLSGVA